MATSAKTMGISAREQKHVLRLTNSMNLAEAEAEKLRALTEKSEEAAQAAQGQLNAFLQFLAEGYEIELGAAGGWAFDLSKLAFVPMQEPPAQEAATNGNDS